MNKFSQVMHNRRFEIRRKDGEWQVRSYVPTAEGRAYDIGAITFSDVERAVAFAQGLVNAIEGRESDDGF